VIVQIEAIVISPDHNFVGHFGLPPGTAPALRRERVRLVAGKGIAGDRYSRREAGHPKQITFFDMAVIDELGAWRGAPVPPEAVRRNVFVRGLDLPRLLGRRFGLQGVRFEASADCAPCFWMDHAVAPGAEAFLAGKGGIRARILTDGVLAVGAAAFALEDAGP